MKGNYFLCNVCYDKLMENGLQKRISEPYLVNALSFTEAEARIIEVMAPFITGEFTVSRINRQRIAEVIPGEDLAKFMWYKAKVLFIKIDEKGVEKEIPTVMIVQAESIEEAISSLKSAMRETCCDYRVAKMEETRIMDIIEYNEK